MSIKDIVSNNKKATFTHFRRNQLWYITECGFEFPVPVEDIGDATFNCEEKAMLLMRYIRKHLKAIESGKDECS